MTEDGVAVVKKKLSWLKRLQGDLDADDNVSDSSTYVTDIKSEKIVRKRRKLEKKEESQRRVKKELHLEEEKDEKSKVVYNYNDTMDTQRRTVKRMDTTGTLARRKRPMKTAKEELSKEIKTLKPIHAAEAQSGACLEEQWSEHVDTRRRSGRDHDRAACKLIQAKSSETIRRQEKSRTRGTRSVKNQEKMFAAKEMNVEVISKRRRQVSLCQTVRRNSTDDVLAKRKVRRTAVLLKTESKSKHADPCLVPINRFAGSLKQSEDDKEKVESCSMAEATLAGSTMRDRKIEKSMEILEPVKQEDDGAVSSTAIENEINELDKLKRTDQLECAPPNLEKAESDVIAPVKITEDAKELISLKKAEKTGEVKESLWAGMPHSCTPGDFVKCEFQKTLVEVKTAPKQIKEQGNDERPVELSGITQNADKSVKNADEVIKNSSDMNRDNLVNEVMPIPRRKTKVDELAQLSTAESFIIPKRSFGNSEKGVQTPDAQAIRARTGESQSSIDKNSSGPSVSVTMPPLPSPGSDVKMLKVVDSIHSPTTRLKKPVPVKTTSISMHDRALMRLSRKRNSIFMAAMELSAQAPDCHITKGRMMGYDVYDVDGKVVPDLITRLSCATEREMALNREPYAASFFGVSLSAPEAAGKSSFAVDEYSKGTRKISCYEELRFKRSEDREFYQRRIYGTVFVPQNLRGWITLVVRNARFERKSTGIRFNQDRDREEFAASLSKRYTLNNSVPRCDISRDNWLKLMTNQPGSVYLHYYNREDAEQASHIFRDDFGYSLELKLNLKAGAVIRTSSSTPRRSHSTERNVPESSPSSSKNDSARNTSSWRRERLPVSRGDSRYFRYDRGAPQPIVPWFRGGRRHETYDGGGNHSCAMIEGRSRSRSRSNPFHGWQNESGAHEGKVDQGGGMRNSASPLMLDAREKTDSGNEKGSSGIHSNADTPVQKRARSSPCSFRRSPNFDLDRSKRELILDDDRRGQEDGEIMSRLEVNPVRVTNGRGGRGGRGELNRARSPSRRWLQEPSNIEISQRRDTFSKYLCNRSRSPAARHHFNQQRSDRYLDKRRSRSRSRSRSRPGTLPMQSGRGFNYSNQYMGHREFKHPGAYDDRRMYFDRGRGNYSGRGRGPNSRSRQ
ncbi:unnamed protein product [Peronospora belbahrii]|uniref:RRM domain-containing protein n=1 Tax=Peronospora belbahrii TaxID=622444 RepID=A0AAU9L2Z3_9STRA|nr:unnamed protein product [Peronospora belbahrii]CAH0521712.1 unnamed protein product [Peronospora belbahrii]